MSQSAPELKPLQGKLLAELLTAPSVDAAAKRAGCSRRTATRWLHEDAAFRGALQTAKQESVDQAVTLLATLAGAAVSTLARNLQADEPAVQVRAAGKLLECLLRVREHTELVSRIALLEAQANGQGAP